MICQSARDTPDASAHAIPKLAISRLRKMHKCNIIPQSPGQVRCSRKRAVAVPRATYSAAAQGRRRPRTENRGALPRASASKRVAQPSLSLFTFHSLLPPRGSSPFSLSHSFSLCLSLSLISLLFAALRLFFFLFSVSLLRYFAFLGLPPRFTAFFASAKLMLTDLLFTLIISLVSFSLRVGFFFWFRLG